MKEDEVKHKRIVDIGWFSTHLLVTLEPGTDDVHDHMFESSDHQALFRCHGNHAMEKSAHRAASPFVPSSRWGFEIPNMIFYQNLRFKN